MDAEHQRPGPAHHSRPDPYRRRLGVVEPSEAPVADGP